MTTNKIGLCLKKVVVNSVNKSANGKFKIVAAHLIPLSSSIRDLHTKIWDMFVTFKVRGLLFRDEFVLAFLRRGRVDGDAEHAQRSDRVRGEEHLREVDSAPRAAAAVRRPLIRAKARLGRYSNDASSFRVSPANQSSSMLSKRAAASASIDLSARAKPRARSANGST